MTLVSSHHHFILVMEKKDVDEIFFAMCFVNEINTTVNMMFNLTTSGMSVKIYFWAYLGLIASILYLFTNKCNQSHLVLTLYSLVEFLN